MSDHSDAHDPDAYDDADYTVGKIWRECWQVQSNPCTGVRVAWPVQAWVVDGVAPADFMKYGCQYVAMEREYRVDWLGWNPDVGLVWGQGLWASSPDYPKPRPPMDGWSPLASRTPAPRIGVWGARNEDTKWTPDPACLRGLPYPSCVLGVPGLGYDTCNRSSAVRQWTGLRDTYLDLMPADTRRALSVLRGATSQTSPLPQSDLEDGRLDYLLGGGPTHGVEPRVAGSRRRQFVLAHAPFADLGTGGLDQAIVHGQSVTPTIAHDTGYGVPLVRALCRVEDWRWAQMATRARGVPELLGNIEPSWLGGLGTLDPDGWASIATLGAWLSTIREEDSRGLARTMMARTLAFRGDLGGLGAMREGLLHLSDMVDHAHTELVRPALEWTGGQGAGVVDSHGRLVGLDALCAALAMGGVGRLAAQSSAHMQMLLAMEQEYEGADAQQSWPAIAAEQAWPGGLSLRCLVNPGELGAEGQALEHCVRSYAHRCRTAGSAILSIGVWTADQDPKWQPSSTVELGSAQGTGLEVLQHRGARNAPPHAPDVAALTWWMAGVATGSIVLEHALIQPPGNSGGDAGGNHAALGVAGVGILELDWRNCDDDPIERRLGQDWRTGTAHARRWARWQRVLDTRAPGFADWLAGLAPQFRAASPAHAELVEQALKADQMAADQRPPD